MGLQTRATYPIATRINSNTTTAIKGLRLGRLIVGTAGATWTLTVQNSAGTTTFIVISGNAQVALEIGWEFGQGGCQIVSAGTTPGDVMVLSE